MVERKSYIKRLSAAALLLIFLFIQGLKLVHSHSYKSYFSPDAECEAVSHAASSSATVDCSICEYQIVKNTDFQFCCWEISLQFFKTDFNGYFTLFPACPSFSLFETRGPPAFA